MIKPKPGQVFGYKKWPANEYFLHQIDSNGMYVVEELQTGYTLEFLPSTILGDSLLILDELVPEATNVASLTKNCDCKLTDLLARGCNCGGI